MARGHQAHGFNVLGASGMSALDLEGRDERLLDLFDRGQEIVTASAGFQFTEGAVWNPAEKYLVSQRHRGQPDVPAGSAGQGLRIPRPEQQGERQLLRPAAAAGHVRARDQPGRATGG